MVVCVSAHPSFVQRNVTCADNPPFLSYHIHILFWQNNANHTAGALTLREKFVTAFKLADVAPCRDLFFDDNMCMFETDFEPVGPFVVAQWAVYILPNDYQRTVTWMAQNRGNYDMLVHPNSGCETEDHTAWALWGGKSWDIDFTIFHHDTPFPWPPSPRKRYSH